MTDVVTLPTIGFARGSVVRNRDDGPNMLVVRSYGERTVVVVITHDDAGNVRMTDIATSTLRLILPAQTPSVVPSDIPLAPDWPR